MMGIVWNLVIKCYDETAETPKKLRPPEGGTKHFLIKSLVPDRPFHPVETGRFPPSLQVGVQVGSTTAASG